MRRLILQGNAKALAIAIRNLRFATHVSYQMSRTKSPVDRMSEQQTSARGKSSPRVSPGNSTLKAKGTTKVCAAIWYIEVWYVRSFEN